MHQQTTNSPAYTEYHPRWYRKRVSTYWWVGERHYLKFILRELSSVFVAFGVAVTLLLIRALRAGPEAYSRFQQLMRSPVMIALCIIALFFVVFHTMTWFNLAPAAMPMKFRGKRLPVFFVAAPNYAAWVVVSAAVAWLLLR